MRSATARAAPGAGAAAMGHRRVRFLEKMTASILANNRSIAPFGMAGGAPGEAGRNWIERVDGTHEDLPHIGSPKWRRETCSSLRLLAAVVTALHVET